MRAFRNFLGAALLVVCSIATSITPASAADVVLPNNRSAPTVSLVGIDACSAAYTNATTSYTDITGCSVTIPATAVGSYTRQYIRVCWDASVIKATSTTGSIRVYANGAGIAASVRTSGLFANTDTLASCYTVARSSAALQTVTIQGVSADTAVFTVNFANMEVYLITVNPN